MRSGYGARVGGHFPGRRKPFPRLQVIEERGFSK